MCSIFCHHMSPVTWRQWKQQMISFAHSIILGPFGSLKAELLAALLPNCGIYYQFLVTVP